MCYGWLCKDVDCQLRSSKRRREMRTVESELDAAKHRQCVGTLFCLQRQQCWREMTAFESGLLLMMLLMWNGLLKYARCMAEATLFEMHKLWGVVLVYAPKRACEWQLEVWLLGALGGNGGTGGKGDLGRQVRAVICVVGW